MTRYDEPQASDGHGGEHGLAGVPQAVLDAATAALQQATWDSSVGRTLDSDDVEAVAHAVLLAARQADRAIPVDPTFALVRIERPHDGCQVFDAVIITGSESLCAAALSFEPMPNGPDRFVIVEVERTSP